MRAAIRPVCPWPLAKTTRMDIGWILVAARAWICAPGVG